MSCDHWWLMCDILDCIDSRKVLYINGTPLLKLTPTSIERQLYMTTSIQRVISHIIHYAACYTRKSSTCGYNGYICCYLLLETPLATSNITGVESGGGGGGRGGDVPPFFEWGGGQ